MSAPSPSGPRLLVLTGLAGAGRSTAAAWLARDDWNVLQGPDIDAAGFLELTNADPDPRVALSAAPTTLPTPEVLRATPSWEQATVVYLEAAPQTLLNRFQQENRPHPLEDGTAPGLMAALQRDRTESQRWRAAADVIIDTTDHLPQQLQRRIADVAHTGPLAKDSPRQCAVRLMSFGFKHGTPRDVSALFDVRALKNPYWRPDLRGKGGTDPDIRRYVGEQATFGPLSDNITGYLESASRAGQCGQTKAALGAGIGCTGGRHRSVSMVEEVRERLERAGLSVSVLHRDLER